MNDKSNFRERGVSPESEGYRLNGGPVNQGVDGMGDRDGVPVEGSCEYKTCDGSGWIEDWDSGIRSKCQCLKDREGEQMFELGRGN